MIEVIKIMFIRVGSAIFTIPFMLGAWLIVMLARRLYRMDVYRIGIRKTFLDTVSDVLLQGIGLGFVYTIVLVLVGIPIEFNSLLLFIVPISIVMGIYRVRLLNTVYALGVITLVVSLLNDQVIFGRQIPNMEESYPSILVLIGLLLLGEGFMLFVSGKKSGIPIISQKDDHVVIGHLFQKTWLLPIAMLMVEVVSTVVAEGIKMPDSWPLIQMASESNKVYWVLPAVFFLNHTSVSYIRKPETEVRVKSVQNIILAVIALVLARLTLTSTIAQVIAIIGIIIGKEGLHHFARWEENHRRPLYYLPDHGARIMQVLEGGHADKIGMEIGETLMEIDENTIMTPRHFIHLAHRKRNNILIKTVKPSGETCDYNLANNSEVEQLGIRLLPEKPALVYPYDRFDHVGLFEYLKRVGR